MVQLTVKLNFFFWHLLPASPKEGNRSANTHLWHDLLMKVGVLDTAGLGIDQRVVYYVMMML